MTPPLDLLDAISSGLFWLLVAGALVIAVWECIVGRRD
jgi:hypothetical protein